jgi:general stress protein YciG
MNNPNPSITESISSPNVTPAPQRTAKRRGFALLSPEQVRELARRGGVAAHRSGTAHEFTSDEARVAGRKGGLATHSRSQPASVEEANELQDRVAS